MNLYTDPYAYIRAASGHDATTVISNLTRIASPGITAGATSIPVSPAITVELSVNDIVTIFDGASSEEVTVTSTTWQNSSSIPCTATQYAHATGTPLASDGTQGSLASMIIAASSEIEGYCRQPLLTATYSNEKLPLRSMRASVTRDYALLIRPMHFPVQSVSSLTLQLNATTTFNLDASQIVIDAATGSQVVTVQQMTSTTGTTSLWGLSTPPAFPTTPGFVLISYTAGLFTATTLPREVRQACTWLVSDLLSDRRNPTGAAETKYGDVQLTTRLRGDTSGRSVLVIRAYEILDRYRQRAI